MTEEISENEISLSKEEANLYDRQIRLWGLDAQRRLRGARILLSGLGGLGAEVAKNVTLAGVRSILLLDDAAVREEDSSCQFLVSREDRGKNRAEASRVAVQLLNPMVDVRAEACAVGEKPDAFFSDFDVVCVTNCPLQQVQRVNEICREKDIKFFCGDVYGFYGYLFSDLGEHEYAEEVERPVHHRNKDGASNEPPPKRNKVEMETVTVKKSTEFCRFKDAMEQKWNDFSARRLKRTPNTFFIMRVLERFRSEEGRRPRPASADTDIPRILELRDKELAELGLDKLLVDDSFAQHCMSELAPVSAIVGGILGQDIIKAVSKKDEPHNNFFFYNGLDGNGMVDKIGYE